MNYKTIKKIIKTILICFVILFISGNISNAALQANQNTANNTKNKFSYWMTEFRKMETTGGAMGLTETLNSDLTSSSGSNNIDVHMMRSTEFGAIAILSASGYGNPSNAQVLTTTTGNNTGIIMGTWHSDYGVNSEAVAGGISGIFPGVNNIYYDIYTTDRNSAKIGDALGTSTSKNPGCYDWHSTESKSWVGLTYSYFGRGNSGIFGAIATRCLWN